METLSGAAHSIRFDRFELDLRSGELFKDGLRMKLQEQPFQVLAMLLARPGEVVTREEIQKRLWPADTFVDFEHGLNRAINKLREVLSDNADRPRLIETLPRRGYRFIAPVSAMMAAVHPVEAGGISPRRSGPQKAQARTYPRWVAPAAGILAAVGLGLGIARFLTRRPPSAPSLTVRRLTANAPDNAVAAAVISPDGKFLAYADPKGMHLKILHTGEVLDVPQPEGPSPVPGSWAPNGWFPDSTRFVAAGVKGNQVSAWVVSVAGGPPRKLRDDADPWSVSPDGSLIAFGTGRGFIHAREIWVMGPQGEDPRRFVSGSEDDNFFWTAWSPDGQRAAFARFHGTPERLACSLESHGLKGAEPTVLVSDPRLCFGWHTKSVWFADGRFLFTMSQADRNHAFNDLWEISADPRTGRPSGDLRQITNWPQTWIGDLSRTADGKQLAVTTGMGQLDVYVGELGTQGRTFKKPRRLTLEESNDLLWQWTPDSKAVLFVSDRNDTWGIYKQALDQEIAQTIVTGPDYKHWLAVTPDGSWIVYLSRQVRVFTPTTPVRIMRVPTSGGAPQTVLTGQGISALACARHPAAVCAFSERGPDQKQVVISAFDAVQGKGRELARLDLRGDSNLDDYIWDLSPDGSRLAYAKENEREARIWIQPLGGGQTREIKAKGWGELSWVRWTADMKGLFVAAVRDGASVHLRVDLEGRANVLWHSAFFHGFGGEIPSPDGRFLAVRAFVGGENAWLLENF